MEGARSILLSITGGRDLSLWEVNEAAKAVAEAAHPDANIIFGAMVDEKLDDQVWVTVVATGYGDRRPRRRARRALRGAGGRAARASARASRARATARRADGREPASSTSPEFMPRRLSRARALAGAQPGGPMPTAASSPPAIRSPRRPARACCATGGNAVDAAVAAMLTSWVAEPLLTGPGAGGYMLVAGAGEEPTLLDFFVAAPGRGADAGAARGAACRSTCRLRRRDPGLQRRRRVVRRATATRPGSCEAARRWGTLPLAELAAPGRGAGARGRRAQRRSRRTSSRSSTAILASTPEARGAVRARRARCCARATRSAQPELGDAIERLGAEGAAPFYTGDIAARGRRRGSASAAGTLTAEDLAAYEAVAREPVRVALPRPRRCSPTRRRRPAACCSRSRWRVLDRSARRRRRSRDIVDAMEARAGRAHARVRRRASPSRASRERFLAVAPRLDDAHLRARRRRAARAR